MIDGQCFQAFQGTVLDGEVKRRKDEELGINLWTF